MGRRKLPPRSLMHCKVERLLSATNSAKERGRRPPTNCAMRAGSKVGLARFHSLGRGARQLSRTTTPELLRVAEALERMMSSSITAGSGGVECRGGSNDARGRRKSRRGRVKEARKPRPPHDEVSRHAHRRQAPGNRPALSPLAFDQASLASVHHPLRRRRPWSLKGNVGQGVGGSAHGGR